MPSMKILLKGQRENKDGVDVPARVFGVTTRAEAISHAFANPPTMSGFVLSDVEAGEYYALQNMVLVTLRYKPDADDEERNPIPDPTYSFDYTGGQVFRQVAIDTACYPAAFETYCTALESGGENFSMKKPINFNRDERTVDGVNLPILSDVVQYTKNVVVKAENFSIDTDLFNIYRYRLHTNLEAWGAFPAKSVLFLGASGTLGSDDRWSISYKFAVGANRESATDIVTGFTINKNAHDYVEVWFDFVRGVSDLFKKPVGVKVHKVYNEVSFSLLNGVIGD